MTKKNMKIPKDKNDSHEPIRHMSKIFGAKSADPKSHTANEQNFGAKFENPKIQNRPNYI